MKKLLFLFLIFQSIGISRAQNAVLNLIPQPVEIQQNKGIFTLNKSATVSFNKPESSDIAEKLVQKLNIATGFETKTIMGNKGSIQLNLNQNPDPKLGNEGYSLISTTKGIVIRANQPAGLFYGMQTLLQLLPKEIESKVVVKTKWTIPAVKITDYPRFAWRGLMLDVSRHFFTKQDVMKYIDEMARLKFNTFHWHLTDDEGWRIQIKSLPKLTEVGAWRVQRYGHFGDREFPKPGETSTDGGFYTQDDIREVVNYAKEQNITIVPEIDVPGHSMAAIASYPELSCKKDTSTRVSPGIDFIDWYGNSTFRSNIENALNPADENVYIFLEKVFTEVAALFPGQYIHVGGDECYKGYWAEDVGCKALMKELGIRHVEDLQGYFMNRVEGILKKNGKKLIGWDEILDGGISPEATVMSWRGIKGGIEAAKMGHDVVMSPTTFAYLDYVQGERTVDPPIYASLRLKKSYSFEPVPDGVDPKYILGGQGNLWTEQVPSLRHAQYMVFPRAWALSEVYWSPKENKNWDNFILKVEKHFERSDIAEINYSKAIYDPIIKTRRVNGKLELSMETEAPNMEIFFTIDDAMPDNYTSKYSTPLLLPDGPITLRAITYRDGKPIGHLITLKREELEKRAGN
ncbi:MAG: beta-N-acetylhexosaminidase [Bacteroidales bacterium]